MRVRVDLIAPPFSGHLHPILAIGRELAEEFEVRVVSTPGAEARIRAAGLVAVPILGPAHDRQLAAIADPPTAIGSDAVRLYRQFRATLASMRDFRTALLALYRDARPDLAIVDFVLAAAGPVCDARGIAWWTSLPSPCVIETRDGPPAYLGGLRPAAGRVDGAVHAIGRRATRTFKRLVHVTHRRTIAGLGVAHLYRDDGHEAIYSPACILALGLEELEFARTWPPALRFVGPQLYGPPAAVPSPTFAAGRRHVLVTCGTHLRWFKETVAAATREVARALPDVVFHVSDGDATGTRIAADGNFVRLPYVDYGALGRYDLVVHHGGAGVMYHCLREGRPAIVLPVDYDQFDHAARLEHARAALWLRRPAGLGDAVRRGLSGDPAFAGCRAFERRIREVVAERRVLALVRRFAADRASDRRVSRGNC